MTGERFRVSATEALITKLFDQSKLAKEEKAVTITTGEEVVTYSFSLVSQEGQNLPVNIDIYIPENRNKGMAIWSGITQTQASPLKPNLLVAAMQGWVETKLHNPNYKFSLGENGELRLVRSIRIAKPDAKTLDLTLWDFVDALTRVKKQLELIVGK